MFARKPDEVFTPRSAEVNTDMYVDRSDLELKLMELVEGSKHFVVHGESGNGKSWLYKRVFEKKKVSYLVINLANASRHGSIAKAFSEKLDRASGSEEELKQIVTNRDMSFMPERVGVSWTKQRVLEVVKKDPVEACMGWLKANSGRRNAVIVLDNFETIVGKQKLVEELSDILLLLDDSDYAKFGVKFCIVGVPSDLRSYLTAQGNLQSLSNRIAELPEVARLSLPEAKDLLVRGFKLLKIQHDANHIDRMVWSTDRIAQYVQEFGLEVAKACLRQGEPLSGTILKKAEMIWFDGSISSTRQSIETNLNARETRAGRRNQVIYALGCIKTEDFKYSDIEAVVREEFAESTAGVELNIIQRLGELEKSAHPLIKRVPKGDAYRMINPKVKIAIRVMLRRYGNKVEKVPELT